MTTTYSYNLAGDMRLIHYNDPAMTDVATTRDAQGRVASIVDGSGTRTYSYTAAGLPLSESTAAVRSMQWDYDAAGRKAGQAERGRARIPLVRARRSETSAPTIQNKLLSLVPEMSSMKGFSVDGKQTKRVEAMVLSMTQPGRKRDRKSVV